MRHYYIFDNIEIIMGPYETWKQASDDLDMHQSELYMDLYYPAPYIDFIDDDEFEEYNPEDIVKRERIIKRRIKE